MPIAVTARINTCLFLLLLIAVSSVTADEPNTSVERRADSALLPFALYRTPAVPTPTESDRAKTCLALEREMTELVPQTYSYKPDFYNDPYQGAAVWIGTTLFQEAYALSAFAGFLQFRENGRMISAEERIEVLRHLKAQNRCFET
ncbi:hypothetical protein [Sedimenticola hydrogenitrophicus]|uniref:hypothetical protein n=1 Tax=Sedimenticola hydrogenitrophicus TaxID=2967975 RepID=UPI0021A7B479|nr:hypothetical protein [Sedimenticola hydrogenitrophicus]